MMSKWIHAKKFILVDVSLHVKLYRNLLSDGEET